MEFRFLSAETMAGIDGALGDAVDRDDAKVETASPKQRLS